MSFRDFNDEGPGTFAWDYVLGGNTSGVFPSEKHYEVDGDLLTEISWNHTGGGKYEAVYGNSWHITDVSPVHKEGTNDCFTFEQDGYKYKAKIRKEFSTDNDCCIVDLEEL